MSGDSRAGMPEPGARVVVAMSGGVDSSVAAAVLAGAGYEVVGISMRLAGEGTGHGPTKSSGCCSLEDFNDAGRVAAHLGLPHYVFDMREEFAANVVRPFVEEYLAGRTPSPCILCNREIKFSLLRRKARELGAGFVATGHYARRSWDGRRYRLLRGRDRRKDQSYFLFEMGQDELAHTLFPVGELAKSEVRAFARSQGLPVADKPDSQEICFVPDGRYADFVERIAGDRVRAGEIRDEGGRRLGRHGGVQRFTVGQRRGLGVSAREPLYVSAIDARDASVTVSPRAGLGCTGLVADGVVWTAGRPEPLGASLETRIRHRHTPVPARLAALDGRRARIEFEVAEEAVSPGQAAVFYRGDEVVGGGWIVEAVRDEAAAGGRQPCA